MNMGMVVQVLTPGVEHGQEADLRAKAFGIGSHLKQCFRGGTEQDPIDHAGVLQGDRADRLRERKNHVKILGGKQFGRSCVQPPCGGGTLALGAMAVAARVVRNALMPAAITGLDVPAQGRGPTGRQVTQDTSLFRGEGIAKLVEKR